MTNGIKAITEVEQENYVRYSFEEVNMEVLKDVVKNNHKVYVEFNLFLRNSPLLKKSVFEEFIPNKVYPLTWCPIHEGIAIASECDPHIHFEDVFYTFTKPVIYVKHGLKSYYEEKKAKRNKDIALLCELLDTARMSDAERLKPNSIVTVTRATQRYSMPKPGQVCIYLGKVDPFTPSTEPAHVNDADINDCRIAYILEDSGRVVIDYFASWRLVPYEDTIKEDVEPAHEPATD